MILIASLLTLSTILGFLFPNNSEASLAWVPLVAAGIGALGSIGGGLIGKKSADEDREKAMFLAKQSVEELTALGIPSVEAQRLVLEEYKNQGILTPELEQSILLGDSQMGAISLDPRYKQAQLDALTQLQQIGQEGGMTLSDRAAMERELGNITSDERGRRQAILQSVRERGQLGSGLELMAQLQNQQDSAGQARQIGLEKAGMAQQRALDAISQAGNLGGNIRGQEFGEQQAIAQAKDAISKWNAANRQDVLQRNVMAKNAAQERNLSQAQQMANSNVDLRNQAQQNNKNLIQQQFQNRFNVEQAKSNARSGQANMLNQNAQNTQNMWSGIGNSVGRLGNTVGQYFNSAPATQAQKPTEEEIEQANRMGGLNYYG